MISLAELSERLSSARLACQNALQRGPMRQVQEIVSGPQAFELLGRATALRNPEPHVLDELRSKIPGDEVDLAHGLLLVASLHAVEQMPTVPVSDPVKDLFAEEFLFYAAPSAQWRAKFLVSEVRFQEMGRIATLQRFPAGEYHWELAAFPRSWLPKVGQLWKAATQAFLPMRGFGPLFELHLNYRRKNRVAMLESETALSCYRAARSLALQPRMRGIMTTSWLYCKSTATVTPHLAWLGRFFEAAGATVVDVGDAPADSGFLVGSTERRKLYDEGKYRPKMSCVLWPRSKVLRWADQHPELGR